MIPAWFLLLCLGVLCPVVFCMGYYIGWGRRGAYELIKKLENHPKTPPEPIPQLNRSYRGRQGP